MTTLRLNINEKVLEKVILFLKNFSADEVEIIEENDTFRSNKAYLQKELKEITNLENKFISHSELELALDEVIAKHENRL